MKTRFQRVLKKIIVKKEQVSYCLKEITVLASPLDIHEKAEICWGFEGYIAWRLTACDDKMRWPTCADISVRMPARMHVQATLDFRQKRPIDSNNIINHRYIGLRFVCLFHESCRGVANPITTSGQGTGIGDRPQITKEDSHKQTPNSYSVSD